MDGSDSTEATPSIPRRVTDLERVIAAQPDSISQAITSRFDDIREAAVRIAAARRVRLAGAGISACAATVGEHMLRSVGVDARAAHAFDLATYPPSFDPGDLLIVLAHRDSRAYAARVAQRASHASIRTIAIVGDGAHISGADLTIGTVPQGGPSTSSTAFTGAVAVMAAAVARFEPRSPLASSVPAFRESSRSMLPSRETARDVARETVSGDRRVLLAGAGVSLPVASAGAFLIRETAHVSACAMHLEDALHSGVAALRPDDILIEIAPEGLAEDRHADLARMADAIGIQRWKIGGAPVRARWYSPLPPVAEIATPLASFVPLQWLALELALALDLDPDVMGGGDALVGEAYARVLL